MRYTASSLASVSSAPPMVSFNVSKTSSSWAAWQRATHVGVHRLTAADAELAAIFASGSGGAARFEQVEWSLGPHDVPVLRGPGSWLLGRIGHRIEAGDSSVLIAEVRQVAQAVQAREPVGPADGSSEHPLVYATGQFALALPLALPPARVSAA